MVFSSSPDFSTGSYKPNIQSLSWPKRKEVSTSNRKKSCWRILSISMPPTRAWEWGTVIWLWLMSLHLSQEEKVLFKDVRTHSSSRDKRTVKHEHETQGKCVPEEKGNADKWFACHLSTRTINWNILFQRITLPWDWGSAQPFVCWLLGNVQSLRAGAKINLDLCLLNRLDSCAWIGTAGYQTIWNSETNVALREFK